MFELSLLAGLGGIVACFLKGRTRSGLAAVALGALLAGIVAARGDASAGDVSTPTLLLISIGAPLWAGASILLATLPARRGSYWERRAAVDRRGRPLLAQQPTGRRLLRSLLGAIVGLAPAVTFMLLIVTTYTGDQAQLAFLAIPIGAFGLLVGAWVGFNWLPRGATGTAERSRP